MIEVKTELAHAHSQLKEVEQEEREIRKSLQTYKQNSNQLGKRIEEERRRIENDTGEARARKERQLQMKIQEFQQTNQRLQAVKLIIFIIFTRCINVIIIDSINSGPTRNRDN